MKRAAHFLLVPELAYSPPNDAIVSALLNLGYEVDLFAPGEGFSVREYGDNVSSKSVNYNNSWILKNIFKPGWKKYDLFSGTSEDPMAVVGVLSCTHRKPSFCLADEIRSDSYCGNRPENWKRLCRWGMRHSMFNIVNDEARVELQKEYARLPKNCEVIVYPGCFKDSPTPADKHRLRNDWKIPEDKIVMAYSGGFNTSGGADWFLSTLDKINDIYLVLQPLAVDDLTDLLLRNLKHCERLYVENKRLGWREAWASMGGVDIGVSIYLNPAPQFQAMGLSSNRLCMFLAMGIPVIASQQKSFAFIEDYNCGVLVKSGTEFINAVKHIINNLEEMKNNAKKCFNEYINIKDRFNILQSKLSEIPN